MVSAGAPATGGKHAKACCVCGTNLAGEKRYKDHEGRYWCCDCAKCNRFSMLFEALRGVPDPLPAMSLRFIDRMDTVRMWNYCHALKGNARYEASPFFAPGRKSLDLIRLMITHRRGMPCISMPTDFLTEFQTSRDFPMIETPFNSWLADRLEIFETSIRHAFSRSKRT